MIWEKCVFQSHIQLRQGIPAAPVVLCRDVELAFKEILDAAGENIKRDGMWTVLVRYEAPAEGPKA